MMSSKKSKGSKKPFSAPQLISKKDNSDVKSKAKQNEEETEIKVETNLGEKITMESETIHTDHGMAKSHEDLNNRSLSKVKMVKRKTTSVPPRSLSDEEYHNIFSAVLEKASLGELFDFEKAKIEADHKKTMQQKEEQEALHHNKDDFDAILDDADKLIGNDTSAEVQDQRNKSGEKLDPGDKQIGEQKREDLEEKVSKEVPEDEVLEKEVPEDEVPEDEVPEDPVPEDEVPEDEALEEGPEDEDIPHEVRAELTRLSNEITPYPSDDERQGPATSTPAPPRRQRRNNESLQSRKEKQKMPPKKLKYPEKNTEGHKEDGRKTSQVSESASKDKKIKSRKQWMKERKIEKKGIWVQCSLPGCLKWRQLPDQNDPSQIPEVWTCFNHPDDRYNDCSKVEEDYDEGEHEQSYYFTKYSEGSVVWARMAGYPWWPAMVEIDPDIQEYFDCRKHDAMTASHYHVVFFDDKVSRAWLREEAIKPFTGKETASDLGNSKVKGKDFFKQIAKARAKAIEASDLPLKKRLEEYSFSCRFSGRWAPVDGSQEITGHQTNSFGKKRGRPSKQIASKMRKVEGECMDLGDLPDSPEMNALLDNAERFIEQAHDTLDELLSQSENLESDGSDYEPESPDAKPKKIHKKELKTKDKANKLTAITNSKKKRKATEIDSGEKVKTKKHKINKRNINENKENTKKSSFAKKSDAKSTPTMLSIGLDSDVFTQDLESSQMGGESSEQQPHKVEKKDVKIKNIKSKPKFAAPVAKKREEMDRKKSEAKASHVQKEASPEQKEASPEQKEASPEQKEASPEQKEASPEQKEASSEKKADSENVETGNGSVLKKSDSKKKTDKIKHSKSTQQTNKAALEKSKAKPKQKEAIERKEEASPEQKEKKEALPKKKAVTPKKKVVTPTKSDHLVEEADDFQQEKSTKVSDIISCQPKIEPKQMNLTQDMSCTLPKESEKYKALPERSALSQKNQVKDCNIPITSIKSSLTPKNKKKKLQKTVSFDDSKSKDDEYDGFLDLNVEMKTVENENSCADPKDDGSDLFDAEEGVEEEESRILEECDKESDLFEASGDDMELDLEVANFTEEKISPYSTPQKAQGSSRASSIVSAAED